MHNNLWLIQIFRKILCRSGQCTIGGNLGSGISLGINRMIIAAANVRLADRSADGCQNAAAAAVGNSYSRFGSFGLGSRVRIDARNDYGKSGEWEERKEGGSVEL